MNSIGFTSVGHSDMEKWLLVIGLIYIKHVREKNQQKLSVCAVLQNKKKHSNTSKKACNSTSTCTTATVTVRAFPSNQEATALNSCLRWRVHMNIISELLFSLISLQVRRSKPTTHFVLLYTYCIKICSTTNTNQHL